MELVRPVTRAFLHDPRHGTLFELPFLALDNEMPLTISPF